MPKSPRVEKAVNKHFLAVDLGAESGRVILGTVGTDRVALEEVHRFANAPVLVQGGLRWDVIHMLNEIKEGLRKAAVRGFDISSISTDAWGVDYVLLGEKEPLITLPFHYRDSRTEGIMEKVFALVPSEDIFEATGIQFMSINTLYQLVSDLQNRPKVLGWADRFLNIGDYFNYLLSGNLKGEASIASTTQLFDPRAKDWAWDLIARLGLPKNIFPTLVPSGTTLGPLLPEIAAATNLKDTKVIASCTHDTAAAVAAVPGEGDDWAFLSSGTWSLLGVELPGPVINTESLRHNFTNEAGFDGSTMFRKNIVGLWIVQECRRAWITEGKDYDYDTLTSMAENSPPLASLIRPEDPRFGKPGHMPEKIVDYCRETGQVVPTSAKAVIRCALESLALLYADTLETCAMLTGKKFQKLHIVGGGSKNQLLNQWAANATQVRVIAGPAEATATGNILIQARTLGHIGKDLRAIVRNSFLLDTFEPQDAEIWNAARLRFQKLPY